MDKKLKLAIALTIVLTGLAVAIDMNQEPQLKLPLDSQSKKIIEKTMDEFLQDKIFDLVWKKTFHWITFFESLDGFATTGTVTADKTEVVMTTGAVSGNSASISKTPAWQSLITFSEKSHWRTTVSVDTVTAVTEYLVVGSLSTGSYYGFKIVDDSLKGVSYDGSTEKTVDLMTVATGIYNLEARYSPSDKIVFLVNAVERGTIMANLPSPAATVNVNFFIFKITTSSAAAKSIKLSFFEYLQARNILR